MEGLTSFHHPWPFLSACPAPMARSPMHLSFLFSLVILFFLQATSARDIQFFSKITNENTKNPDENKGSINVDQEGLMPTKEESSLTKTQGQEQEPTLLPQTDDNGYGLYGHETGVLPPSSTGTDSFAVASNLPFEPANYNTNMNDKYPYNVEEVEKRLGERDSRKEDQAAYFNNKGMYYNVPEYQGLSGKADYANGGGDSGNGNAYNYNMGEEKQQGMSDTRFLGNGRYYYDLNSERRDEPAGFGYANYNSNSWNNEGMP